MHINDIFYFNSIDGIICQENINSKDIFNIIIIKSKVIIKTSEQQIMKLKMEKSVEDMDNNKSKNNRIELMHWNINKNLLDYTRICKAL